MKKHCFINNPILRLLLWVIPLLWCLNNWTFWQSTFRFPGRAPRHLAKVPAEPCAAGVGICRCPAVCSGWPWPKTRSCSEPSPAHNPAMSFAPASGQPEALQGRDGSRAHTDPGCQASAVFIPACFFSQLTSHWHLHTCMEGIFVPFPAPGHWQQSCSQGPLPTQGGAAKLREEEANPTHGLTLIVVLLAESSSSSVLPLVEKLIFLHPIA